MSTLARPLPSAAPACSPRWRAASTSGRCTLALIVAINTGIALILWNNDPRPFWHPLLTVQIYGLCIAYAVNVAAPWEKTRPFRHMLGAIAVAVLVGVVLVIVLKGYSIDYVREHWMVFGWNIVQAFLNGLLITLLFFVKFREARATAALHRAEAERNLLAKQAVEAELKLMQAQVEPHFLFNTLASVQYLTETDPAAGQPAARSPDRLPARRAAAVSRTLVDARPRVRAREGLSGHPADADGPATRLHRRARARRSRRIHSRRTC